jgi:hypothetical protein
MQGWEIKRIDMTMGRKELSERGAGRQKKKYRA